VFENDRRGRSSSQEQRLESELRRAKDVKAKNGSRIRGPRATSCGITGGRVQVVVQTDEAPQRLAGAAKPAARGTASAGASGAAAASGASLRGQQTRRSVRCEPMRQNIPESVIASRPGGWWTKEWLA